jgi:hypothetical protein
LQPERVTLDGGASQRLLAWSIPAEGGSPSPYWMLYLHGNAANITSSGNVTRYHQLRSLGVNVLAPEYPGYGELDGLPSERNLHAAARAAYAHLRDGGVEGRHIAIYGWSLGSGGAVPLAARVDEAALVLEGAFSSVLRTAQAQYPYLPISLMIRNPFLSEGDIASTGSPTLSLHSPEDAIVPFADGRRLYDRARAPKTLITLRGGHITPNLDDADRYLGAVYTFLTQHAGWSLQQPRRSAGVRVRAVLEREGLASALVAYSRMQTEGSGVWSLAEYELAHLGVTLSRQARHAEAIAILRLNAARHPESPMAQYHLGQAFAAADDAASARQCYERSLAMERAAENPSHAALARLDAR